ncbi:TadE/TadG family type IV pilus assembly protein [Nocardioides bruguierae]|uniref:TadE/TadG family type IV pilus assembly protein n=1 Tax=Nocardioides bruguierae TaxID=2945102 RepID=UPI0020209DD5|nr:pilus assembly protein TadG-related protein [Nocardioides bruguierae]MCL8024825.1 pilus assembly protein TadG-related protein [Nocardioides bruguierae]
MSTRRAARRSREDRGAVAVLVAILAVVLIGIGAFAVDLGQAYAKKSLLQTDVDVAAMAAAAELTQEDGCNAEVIDTAEEYLTHADNAVPGQYPIDLGGSAGDGDGFISCSDWTVHLWAPASEVELGLGQVISDSDSFDVASYAAAQVGSPAASGTLPFFGVQGCDYGSQTIRDDSGSPTSASPPSTFVPDSGTHNNIVVQSVTPDTAPSPADDGTTTAMTVTVDGTHMNNARYVGFTSATGQHYEALISPVPSNGQQTVTVSVPSDVLAAVGTWWVRIKGSSGNWSNPTEAKPFQVGDDLLYCDNSNEGNFGTIDVPRTDGNAGNRLALNMILGVQPELAIHPSPNGECGGDPSPTVESKNSPVDGTNCLLSEPGLKVSATNDGMVLGADGHPGRLDADSTHDCSRNGSGSRTSGAVKGKTLNDDLLTCFIINGASINDLVSGNASGTHALSADIFDSPRFFWIPIVDTDPSNGAKSWPIIAFRPGFITDQSLSATNAAPGSISSLNGVEADSSGIRALHVVLFSEDALPETAAATGDEISYRGSGTRVLTLVE